MNGNNHSSFSLSASLKTNKKRLIFYLATVSVIAIIYIKFSEISLIKELFFKSNLFWLSAIVASQIVRYYFVTLNYQDVLKIKDLEVSIKELFPVTFVIQFLNQALPAAGLSGQAFFIQYLKKFRLTLAEGMGRAILELATVYISFAIFFIISAVLIFEEGIFDSEPRFIFFVYAFLLFIFFFGALFLASQKRERGYITRWIISRLDKYFDKDKQNGKTTRSEHVAMIFDEIRVTLNLKNLRNRVWIFTRANIWQMAILMMDVLALYFISYAIGQPISFYLAFIVFTLTKFISLASFIPGALGIFEAGMVLILLSFHVPANSALAMTVLLRAFTFWLPMPIGWLLLRRYSKHTNDSYSIL